MHNASLDGVPPSLFWRYFPAARTHRNLPALFSRAQTVNRSADQQMLDTIDKKILTLLQKDGRMTNAKLAQEVGLSPPAVLERVRRLEASGIIAKYVAILDRERTDFGLQTIVMVCLSHHQVSSLQHVKERLTSMTEVLECHQLTGEVDFLLKVAVKDMNAYTHFVNNKLSGIPGIQNVKTSFILETLKNETALKLISDD